MKYIVGFIIASFTFISGYFIGAIDGIIQTEILCKEVIQQFCGETINENDRPERENTNQHRSNYYTGPVEGNRACWPKLL